MTKFFITFAAAFIYVNAQNTNRADELIMNGNYSEAIILLNEMISTDSSNADLYRKAAYCFKASDNYKPAIEYLQKALELKPGDSRQLLMLGDNYMAYEKFNDAKLVYLEYLEQNLNSTDGQLRLAKAFIALKEWALGENVLKKLIGDSCTVASYFELLAKCQESLKEYDDAIISLYGAVLHNPNSVNNVIRLCNLYFKTERAMSAKGAAEAGLKHFSQNADLWRIKAEALFKLDNYKEAIYSYKQALEYGDTSSILYRNLGVCFYVSGYSDSAAFYLDTSYFKKADDCVTAYYAGLVQKDLGNLDSAISFFNRVEKIQMNDYVTESFINLGGVYQQKKDYEASVAYYTKAMELDPERKSVLFRMASTYDEGYKDKTIALKYYTRYTADTVKTDPKLYSYALKRINELKAK